MGSELIRVHPCQPRLPSKRFVLLVILTDCYSEVTAYTALADPYWASFHDAYGY